MRVCDLGALVAEALFPDGKALGKTVLVAGGEYTVVGRIRQSQRRLLRPERRGYPNPDPAGDGGNSHFPNEDRYGITAQAKPGKKDDAQEEIRQLLRRVRAHAGGRRGRLRQSPRPTRS